MSEGFRATPSGLNKPSADLAEVAGRIQAIVSRLDAVNTPELGQLGDERSRTGIRRGRKWLRGIPRQSDQRIERPNRDTAELFARRHTDAGVALTGTDQAGRDDFESI